MPDLPRPLRLAAALTALAALAPAACARAADVTLTTCDASGLVAAIDQANLSPVRSIITLKAGCTDPLSAPRSSWYGPDGLPSIWAAITIDGNGATIARAASAPPFRFFFVGPDPQDPWTLGYGSVITQANGGNL